MNVAVTGATGLIGAQLVASLRARGDAVTVLSRDPGRASAGLGGVEALSWRPLEEPAPAAALSGRDTVVHLAGENIAQRWSAQARQRIEESRVTGTRNLVAGMAAAQPRPRVLVSASAVGYYGPRGDERIPEPTPPGDDFLARVCVGWEREAAAARDLGVRVASLRNGVVLDAGGGALARMLPFFRLGVGGPVAGGDQYLAWIAVEDLVALYLAAIDDERFDGAFNACAPEPATNRDFSRALGRALRRPALAPVPGVAVRALYGQMAEIVTTGQRAVPERALRLGHRFSQPDLQPALEAALA